MAKVYGSLFERLVANTHEPENDQACWVWSGTRHYKGYGTLNLRVDGKHTKVYAHRCMAEIMLERKLEMNEEPDHLCLNRACINPAHLFLGTHADNMQDMWAKGRGRCDAAGRRGSMNGNHRLTETQASEIQRRHRRGEPSRKLGAEFGVSKTLVLMISKGTVWQHLHRSAP